MYEGLAMAADYNNAKAIFSTIAPLLETFSKLFEAYKTSPDVAFYILRVYGELVKVLVSVDSEEKSNR
jgi:hypothetical protein